jgi:glycosyltransferase involved in cell wall biosynthesis
MSISVVIPAYRACGTIRRAVQSVLRQTAPPSEILIVDDGSPDGDDLAASLLPFGSAANLLRKANGGAASARNYGIDHAHCDWIAFLDADDYWEPDKLERQQRVIQARPEVALVGCQYFEEIPGKSRTPAAISSRFCGRLLRLRGREAFDAALVVWTSTLLINREAFAAERFVVGLEPAEDRDLWVRLLAAHPAYILPDLLATCVQEPGGISRTNIDRDLGCMLEVVRRHADLLGRAGLRAQQAAVYRRGAAVHLFKGRPASAFPYALQRLRLQPFSPQAWWIVAKSATSRMARHDQ